jgi:hypothetical protein
LYRRLYLVLDCSIHVMMGCDNVHACIYIIS